MTVPSETFAVVVNPNAGAGRAKRELPALTQALREAGASFELMMTRGPQDATRLAREALSAGMAGVAVAGGDGTINEALNGFFDGKRAPLRPDAWLSVLPFGTGGDFRRTMGLTTNPHAMVTRVLWAKPRPVDVGWVTFRTRGGAQADRAFMNVASFGISGLVDELVNAGPKWLGAPAFGLAALRAKLSYQRRRVRIQVDDEPVHESEVLVCAVGNGRFFGGGMEICPGAQVDDGLLEVVCLEPTSFREEARLLARLYRGRLTADPTARRQRATRVRAEPADWGGAILLDIDGESPGALPADFELLPGRLLFRG